MSGSVNKVILIGNLGRDPEIRRTNSGDPIASFSLATSESWTDKNSGERKDRTEWINVVIFNEGLTKIVEQYCKKGSKVYLEGQLQTREFQDKDGNQRKTTEVVLQRFRGTIVLLDRQERPVPSEDDYGKVSTRERASTSAGNGAFGSGGAGRMADIIDDEVPF